MYYSSDKLFKIHLDTQKTESIKLKDKSLSTFSVSPKGTFLLRGSGLYNLKDKEEWILQGEVDYWSDNEKLSFVSTEGDKKNLYIYDPAKKSQVLVESFTNDSENLKKVGTKIFGEVVGWIH